MGWKYEVETFWYENYNEDGEPLWVTDYQGNSRIKAELALWKARRENPGRCYRLVIR